ncbi:Flp pilus assembly protein CpaB [Bacillus shivajii]|uniref:Flp pilus assembly protein CpaB n=1 Tax=Bacillus shivajii TaxID=1983719 RepID=UPI001CFC374E|nr:Flp pilus assembly protein CpaB [Bacillus shivajii]UCZ53143.1 Flp pilus assembly protein CpaB [Bacillus shivajii]
MRSRTIFLLAAVMGVITTLLFFLNLQEGTKTEEVEVQKVEVVAATETIELNQTITREMIEIREVPEDQVHPAAYRQIGEVEGKFATTFIDQGEIILSHRLRSERDETEFVSRKVQEGFRAVALGVDFVKSVSNLIEPEDYVDVIYTAPTGEDAEIETEIILSNVRVLAVGRKMVEVSEGEPYVEYSSITLELAPEDTITAVHAFETGSIHMTLRSRLRTENVEDLTDDIAETTENEEE